MALTKIISGGQTGADIGGLIAAKNCCITTGGYIPKGFRTDSGNKPELGKLFNLKATETTDYRPRTMLNVKVSDGTVWFGNPQSPGGILTHNSCKANSKPILDMSYPPALNRRGDLAEIILSWININNIKILNVAGNRERINPGIEGFVIKTLTEVFS